MNNMVNHKGGCVISTAGLIRRDMFVASATVAHLMGQIKIVAQQLNIHPNN
jgi:hypothetical protein